MQREQNDESSDITRRTLVRRGGGGLLAVTGGAWLAGCGGSGSTGSSGDAADVGPPKRGGTLRLAGSGGGSTDSLEGQNALSNTDFARVAALYDPLVESDEKGKTRLVLAESIESNKDATEWTIRVRPNVMTHDGKPFGAKDVLFSLRRIEEKEFPGVNSFGPIDLKGAKVMDARTLRIPFKSPYAIFPDGLVLTQTRMVPEGYDVKKPVGTGPFKYVSFTPGRESVFERFDGYWDEGKPYLDKLVITNFDEETSQITALQAGQVDAVDYLSATSIAAAQATGAQVIVSKTGAWGPFTMRMDKKPFDDNRVRQALRLVVDRPQMNQQVYGGRGRVANDVFGIFDPLFQPMPQRTQDIEKAKSLLKAAGQSDLRLEMITTANAPGAINAAQVFATQAKAAGVQTKITNQPPTQYFANSYLKVDFSQDYWPYQPYLVCAGQATEKDAPFNANHQDDPAYNKLYAEGIATLDENRRKEIIGEMIRFDYEQGGYITPYNFPVIDAVSSKVKGVTESVSGVALGNFDWKNIWMEA